MPRVVRKGFRVQTIIRHHIESRNRRSARRLDKFNYSDDLSVPMLRGSTVRYELAGRAVGTAYGGIGLMHQLVRELQLAEAIDARLHLFKIHLPYHESDHVLNLAYNALCDGRCLEDLELRRQDEAYLNLLGAARIPDPTTAGDFCRRFQPGDLQHLQEAYDVARQKVWARQPPEFFAEARIDADGKMVATDAECKDGIDIAYNGVWGYHPLVVSLANTKEVLRLKNRPGNRPSHEGAAALLDECIALCREAGFRRIVLRCDQENLLAQLGACRALHAPVNDLLSNGAYMLMTSLAWNLKAWLALWLPARPGRWHEQHAAQKQSLLACEFRTFVNRLMRVPCQVLTTGRQLVLRLLGWNDWQPVFFRLADALTPARRVACPLRC